MASIEEVKGTASGVLEQMRQIHAGLTTNATVCDEISGQTAAVLLGSGREEASSAVSRIRSAGMSIDDAIANTGIAIEQLEILIANL